MKKFSVWILILVFALSLASCKSSSDALPTTQPTDEQSTTQPTDEQHQVIPFHEIDFTSISDADFASLPKYYGYDASSLYILDGKNYGRIISSSDSREDAVRVCTRHFTDDRYPGYINTVVKCEVIYESEILYGVYVKWEVEHGGSYEENVISFKKSVADITVPNVVYGDVESYHIHPSTAEQADGLVRYLFVAKYPYHMLNIETSSSDTGYQITIHSFKVVGGDLGVKNEYVLYKHTVLIHSADGRVTFQEPVALKTVFYSVPDGTGA